MDSLQRRLEPFRKRVGRIAAISLAVFVAGWAMSSWGNSRFSRLNEEVGAAAFDIPLIASVNPLKETDLIQANAVNGLIFGLGLFLSFLGVIGLVSTALLLDRKPPRGGILTLRGWKRREELDEKALALATASETVLFGLIAGSSWVGMLWLGAFRLPTIPGIAVFWIIECGLLSCLGIFRCHHHYRHQAAAAKIPWMIAFALNYGGLLAFLWLTGIVLIRHSRA